MFPLPAHGARQLGEKKRIPRRLTGNGVGQRFRFPGAIGQERASEIQRVERIQPIHFDLLPVLRPEPLRQELAQQTGLVLASSLR